MNTVSPFRAFVSYCHADRAFAAWLQKRLETYRLPRRLAGEVAPLPGQAPGRIGPVFRDRPDLSAAENLSEAVRDAIARSSALVVVASPDAAGSRWVAREIELFRELHPKAPVLVALDRGEPPDAMPEALRQGGAEPLAADFRKEGDGKRLAFLKIVAGLTHLPLDALVQRDAQRRVRRVTVVTGAAGVLLLIMALLLVMAMRARAEAERQGAEAERQRSAAEGLVEYMLTDLRERLKGVGRADVMARVNERALAYYAAQGDLSRLSDESLDRRARILHAMGEDDEKRGDMKKALAKFTQAYRSTGAIAARHPQNPDAVFAHAQSEFWIGNEAWRLRDRRTATPHWRGYFEQATRLARLEPGSARSQMELAYAEGGLCDLDLSDSYDVEAAARHCPASVVHARFALSRDPGNAKIKQDLANRYGWLARVQRAQKQYAAALASRGAERALMDELLKADPHNAEYGMRRAWPDVGIARIWLDLGRPADAAALLRRRWTQYGRGMTADKSNLYWESGLRVILYLAKAQRLAGIRAYRASQAEGQKLVHRYIELFPDRGKQVEALVKDIG
jgi:hypothetical protein